MMMIPTIAEAIVEALLNNETAPGLFHILTGKGNTEQEGVKTESEHSKHQILPRANLIQQFLQKIYKAQPREEAVTLEGLSDDSEGAKARIQESLDLLKNPTHP